MTPLVSQSVKTTESCGERGYDAGKKIKGRKRHILTDTCGYRKRGQKAAVRRLERPEEQRRLSSSRA